MDPFIKKVKTQAEKDELLRQARLEYDSGLAALPWLGTWEQYVEKVAQTIEVEETFVLPEPLSPAASAAYHKQVETETAVARIFSNRRTDVNSLPPVLQKFADEQQAAELKEFLAPARRADNDLIEKAVEKVIQKTSGGFSDNRVTIPVRAIPSREGLMPLLTNAVDEDSNTDAAKFLRAFVSGDNEGMRAVIRGMQLEAA